MDTNELICLRSQNAERILSLLPEAFVIDATLADRGIYMLVSDCCGIKITFSRGNASSAFFEVFDPLNVSAGEMSLWILRIVRGIPEKACESDKPFESIGLQLAKYFADVLNGDFRIRQKYNELETPILDFISDVKALPEDHPTRIRFNNGDLQWIADLQQAKRMV